MYIKLNVKETMQLFPCPTMKATHNYLINLSPVNQLQLSLETWFETCKLSETDMSFPQSATLNQATYMTI
jgi:hypothetical protein